MMITNDAPGTGFFPHTGYGSVAAAEASRMFIPQCILPSQQPHTAQPTPERKLAMAILLDAMECISALNVEPEDTRYRRAVRWQALQDLRWLEGAPAPMPFASICAALGLEPEVAAKAILKQCQKSPKAAFTRRSVLPTAKV